MRFFPARQRRPESYYRARRDDFTAGVTIGAGILSALSAGAHEWFLIVRGVRRLDPARGLFAFMWVVTKAAIVGALVGFAIGWTIGLLWELWHRRRRARRGMV